MTNDKLQELSDKYSNSNVTINAVLQSAITEAHALGKSESDNAKAVEVLNNLKTEIERQQGILKVDRWVTSDVLKAIADGKIIGMNESLFLIESQIKSLKENGK
jgi:hypothetical protein